MTTRKGNVCGTGKSYMDEKRALDKRMRNDLIVDTVIIILFFVLTIIAMRLWG